LLPLTSSPLNLSGDLRHPLPFFLNSSPVRSDGVSSFSIPIRVFPPYNGPECLPFPSPFIGWATGFHFSFFSFLGPFPVLFVWSFLPGCVIHSAFFSASGLVSLLIPAFPFESLSLVKSSRDPDLSCQLSRPGIIGAYDARVLDFL